MSRILFAADLHGDTVVLERLKSLLGPGDTLVLVGDLFGGLTNRRGLYTREQVSAALEASYQDLRRRLEGVDCFTVKGNWDPDLYHDLFADLDLSGRIVERAGWRVTGFAEGTDNCQPVCMGSSFFRRPDRPLDDAILASADVWASHFPPFRILDDIPLWEYGIDQHIGNAALAQRIRQHRPSWVICGHIHSAAEGRLDDTRVVRAPAKDPFWLEERGMVAG